MNLSGMVLCFHPDEKDFPVWYEKDDECSDQTTCPDEGGKTPNQPMFVAKGTHRYVDGVQYPAEFYQFYFKRNLSIGLGGKYPTCELLGYHPHDVEGIVVLYSPDDNRPMLVYFKAHGLGQGVWRAWGECQKTAREELVVFVACYSHAMYPSDEKVSRIFGVANDRVSRDGEHMRFGPRNLIEATPKHFAGGVQITDTIPLISNDSITDKQRVLLPIVNKSIRERAKEGATT